MKVWESGVQVFSKVSSQAGGYQSTSGMQTSPPGPLSYSTLTLRSGHAQTIYSALADFSQDDPVAYER